MKDAVWAVRQSSLPGTVRQIADYLAGLGDFIYPSVQKIVEETGRSRRTVQRCVSSLKSAGILIPVDHKNGGRGNSVIYKIDVGELPHRKGVILTPFTEDKGRHLDAKGRHLDAKGRHADIPNKDDVKRLKDIKPCSRTFPGEGGFSNSKPMFKAGVWGELPADSYDPRFTKFRGELVTFWEFCNPGMKLNWTSGDGYQLKGFLGRFPEIDKPRFVELLNDYRDSDNINESWVPQQFLPRLHEFFKGPLNRYGRTVGATA